MIALPAVVQGARGLRISQRGAADVHPPADLRVGPIAPVAPPSTPPLEAHGPDGMVWRRHWDDAFRLIIDFVGVAVVEVDDSGVVTFDRPLPADAEQHLLLDHVLPLVLARGGALVVHGGVVSRGGGGVVLVGSSGAGKSTLTAFAWQRGWTVGSDDGAVLAAGPPPTAEPTYPTVRLSEASMRLLGLDLGDASPVVGKLRLTGQGTSAFNPACVALRVIAIVTPTAAGEPARFEPIGGVEAHAELFGSTFHADLATRRLLPAIVDDLAAIVDTTTIGRLTVPHGLAGLAASERLLRASLDGTHSDRPPAEPGNRPMRARDSS